MVFLKLIAIALSCSTFTKAVEVFSFPVQEKHFKDMYLSLTRNGISIQYNDKSIVNPSGMIENDFISHVNGIPIISKGLSDIFDSSINEMVLPIVDDEDSLNNNNAFKLLGFVSLKLINPHIIKIRRNSANDMHPEALNTDLEESISKDTMQQNSLHDIDKSTKESSQKETDRSGSNNDIKIKTDDQNAYKSNNIASSDNTITDSSNNDESKTVKVDETIESLYGFGKKYPEPYLAGKIPAQVIQRKYQGHSMGQPYTYSVRFRSGPIGMSFDNKLINTTRIEKVVSGQPADQSGVQEGDYLIGIDQYDVSNEPAKTSTKILSLLSYPKVLVFESRLVINDKKMIEENIASRTYTMKIIYPPSLINEFSIRLADWSPPFLWSKENACPVLNIRAPVDPFGCDLNASEFELSSLVKAINSNTINASVVIQDDSMPMLKILHSQAQRQHISTVIISTAIVKRGICSFVDKSRKLQSAGAEFSIIVNNENMLVDIPAGKDKTDDLLLNVGIIKESDGTLLHLGSSITTTSSMNANSIGTSTTTAASLSASYFGNDEVFALITSMNTPYSSACESVYRMAQDIVDIWPRSGFTTDKILQRLEDITVLKSNKRSKEDVGGRVAFGGENGWAYFEYSQALFGPSLPLHPLSFKLAQPVYGCDASKYTVRIADHIVGIIRGGGCSFGIKIINAQKLGAKAVVIINNDESPLMRLMVLPDELSMIQIPCIMVANKVTKYLGTLLKPFYQYDQYILSIQPMAYLGDYETVIA